MKLQPLTNLIYEAAVVRRLKRTGWQIMGDNDEDVGGHVFMTSVLSYILAKECKANVEKVLLMSVFHDFHEARTGEFDKIHKFYATRKEDRANEDIFGELDPKLLELLREYEKKESLEAKIAYEANILALLVELRLLLERGNTHAAEWIEGNEKRLRLPEAVALGKALVTTDSHDWWKNIRTKLHEEFAK